MNIKGVSSLWRKLSIGAAADAAAYGDAGTDTLGHIAQQTENFKIPNLQKLGIANLHSLHGVLPVDKPTGYFARLHEASTGKDTMTGHWEMMGLHITKPFQNWITKRAVRGVVCADRAHHYWKQKCKRY